MVRAVGGTRACASGHGGGRAASRRIGCAALRGLGLALALSLSSWSGLARAQQAQAGRACAAVLDGTLESELLARIRGQSQDVTCELVVGEARADADAVLAIAREADGGYTLSVHVRADGSTHVRSVPAARDAADALAGSATFEAVALVVRGELLELARAAEARRAAAASAAGSAGTAGSGAAGGGKREQGGAGDADPDADPDADADADPDADPDADEGDGDEGGSASDRDPSRAGSPFAASLGWELASIGVSDLAHAAVARAVLGVGPIELGLAAALGFAAALDDAYVEADVRRHTLSGVVAWPFLRASRVRVELGARAGLLLFAREVRRVRDPSLVATSDETLLAFVAGAEGAAELRLVGPIALRLWLGADVVPAAPRYVYELSTGDVEGASSRPLQARAGVGIAARLP